VTVIFIREGFLRIRSAFLILNQMPDEPTIKVTGDVYDTVVDVIGAPKYLGFNLTK
jgi:hypothetical protein